MKKIIIIAILLGFFLAIGDLVWNSLQAQKKIDNQVVIDKMLDKYSKQGAEDFDPERGMALWDKDVGGKKKTCVDCHDPDLIKPSRHKRTGKAIKPMAAWLVPTRYTEEKKIEKWFKQNCRGTWGRDCTPQEKGDFLAWFRAPHNEKSKKKKETE